MQGDLLQQGEGGWGVVPAHGGWKGLGGRYQRVRPVRPGLCEVVVAAVARLRGIGIGGGPGVGQLQHRERRGIGCAEGNDVGGRPVLQPTGERLNREEGAN